jgi:hypothetical protein
MRHLSRPIEKRRQRLRNVRKSNATRERREGRRIVVHELRPTSPHFGNPKFSRNQEAKPFLAGMRTVVVRCGIRCLRSSCAWDLFFVRVAGFARQARPLSRPRYFWAHSETEVPPCCPHLDPLGRGGPESFPRLALTRVPLVAPLGLELGILGEKPQALEGQVDPPSAAHTATQTPGPAPL